MKLIFSCLKRLLWTIYFIIYILFEIIFSSIKVAFEVLNPALKLKPGVVRINTNTKTNLEITLLANLISLTPGTLTLDISKDKKSLFIHTMFANDTKALQKAITQHLERPILEIME